MRLRILGLVIVSVGAVLGALAWATGMFTAAPAGFAWDRTTPAAASDPLPEGLERATFGGGCFWCTEAVFQQLGGVRTVVSGYSGGSVPNPTYWHVCSGATGHAEVIQITFDPKVISFAELLEVFWQTHDPTTLNRQGNDQGTQYRSVIFYHTEQQRALAEQWKQKLDSSGTFQAPVVTEIAPFTEFYRAETNHQNYFVDHQRQPYCTLLIGPKVDKVRQVFKDKVKPSSR
jgi:peptide-methionine (S)-S-oxide reductase